MAAVQTAMVGRLPYTELRDAIFAHPTISEGPESSNSLCSANESPSLQISAFTGPGGPWLHAMPTTQGWWWAKVYEAPARSRSARAARNMFVRDRIEMLIDPGTPFLTLSTQAANQTYEGQDYRVQNVIRGKKSSESIPTSALVCRGLDGQRRRSSRISRNAAANGVAHSFQPPSS